LFSDAFLGRRAAHTERKTLLNGLDKPISNSFWATVFFVLSLLGDPINLIFLLLFDIFLIDSVQ